MNIHRFQQLVKPWMLPFAMLTGIIFHNYMEAVEFLAPYLIFVMLLITFCKISPHELKVGRMSWSLLTVQIVGAAVMFLACRPFGLDLAQGAFICVFCPTATAAPVITGMLGGSMPRLVSYSIVSNIAVAVLTPLLFPLIGSTASLTIGQSMLVIARNVVPLIILPLLVAWLMRWKLPRLHHALATRQSLSFYIWALSLVLVVGRSVSFVMAEPPSKIPEMAALAVVAALMCALQFAAGRAIGRRCGDKISGAQGLGQKNTVLAIWMALTYLNPIASVAPAAYVAWQNTFNSLQLYFKGRRESRSASSSAR